MWDDVTYEPGEIKVIAYDSEGQAAAEKSIRTAGKAAEIKLTPDRKVLKADGEDLCYINVSLTDKEGNPVPTDNRLVKVKVTGNGSFKAIANGDPTCLESFQQPQMHLFSGQLTVLVQSSSQPGEISVEVTGKGVKKAQLTIKTE
jgi:beta-galactosidase